jgi:hypothetical protein
MNLKSEQQLPSDDITLIVEPHIDGCASSGSLTSPDPVFVFGQTGNVGCGGRMIIIETFAPGCHPKHRTAPPTMAGDVDTS